MLSFFTCMEYISSHRKYHGHPPCKHINEILLQTHTHQESIHNLTKLKKNNNCLTIITGVQQSYIPLQNFAALFKDHTPNNQHNQMWAFTFTQAKQGKKINAKMMYSSAFPANQAGAPAPAETAFEDLAVDLPSHMTTVTQPSGSLILAECELGVSGV